MNLYNHIAPKFSDLEWKMVKNIPPGGNWKNIPESVPSQRLAQIRKTGGRTTYYGRLNYNKPSYTISTYFNRIGNGCFIHPDQDRLISIREGARLQSFRDSFIFYGSKTSQYKQIGNAVPPLLARIIAKIIKPYINNLTFIDLFAGAGGMSEGFIMEKYSLLGAIEIEKNYFETFLNNHSSVNSNNNFIHGDITTIENKNKLISIKDKNKIGVVIGGPPCQGFSTAGWRNPKDKRNVLFKEFVYIVKSINPDIFVMENVPGILSIRKGEAIKEIISCFRNIKYYVMPPIILKAEEYGVPQLRKRIFIIGSKKNISITPPKPLFNYRNGTKYSQKCFYNNPNAMTVREAVGGLPPLKAGEGQFMVKTNMKTTSKYEELMMGKINYNNFYTSVYKAAEKIAG